MTHIKPTATPAWQALAIHYDKIKTLHLREMFAKDPGRGERFVAHRQPAPLQRPQPEKTMTGRKPANADLEFGKPGQLGLVIRLNPKTGERSFDNLTWGLLLHNTEDMTSAPRPIWARAETVASLPIFADAFERRRAIIPANEYFQRATAGEVGRRWAISRIDRRPMAWAGLWEGYKARSGEITRSYCVITVAASADVTPIHDRMPLVLEDGDLPLWLGETPGDATTLLRPPAAGILKCRVLTQGARGRP